MTSNWRLRYALFVPILLLCGLFTAIPSSIARSPKVTVDEKVEWVPARNGERPDNAIEVGRELLGPNNGRMLYVCRAKHGNSIHPGKLVGGACNIGYGGKELEKSEYEVAVHSGGSWKSGGRDGALVGGFENNGNLYVCRVNLTETIVQTSFPFLKKANYGMHGGKLLANGHCNFGYGGKELSTTTYELFYP